MSASFGRFRPDQAGVDLHVRFDLCFRPNLSRARPCCRRLRPVLAGAGQIWPSSSNFGRSRPRLHDRSVFAPIGVYRGSSLVRSGPSTPPAGPYCARRHLALPQDELRNVDGFPGTLASGKPQDGTPGVRAARESAGRRFTGGRVARSVRASGRGGWCLGGGAPRRAILRRTRPARGWCTAGAGGLHRQSAVAVAMRRASGKADFQVRLYVLHRQESLASMPAALHTGSLGDRQVQEREMSAVRDSWR